MELLTELRVDYSHSANYDWVEDEDNSVNNLNNTNYQASSQKFRKTTGF